MRNQCLCPNCCCPITVLGKQCTGWVACAKCGHVFKVAEALEPRRRSSLPASGPHVGLRS